MFECLLKLRIESSFDQIMDVIVDLVTFAPEVGEQFLNHQAEQRSRPSWRISGDFPCLFVIPHHIFRQIGIWRGAVMILGYTKIPAFQTAFC